VYLKCVKPAGEGSLINLEHILAMFKRERRRIDKAIDALEELQPAKSKRNKQRTAKVNKRRSKCLQKLEGRHNEVELEEPGRQHGSKVLPFVVPTKRVS